MYGGKGSGQKSEDGRELTGHLSLDQIAPVRRSIEGRAESISQDPRLVGHPIGRKFRDSEARWIYSKGQTVRGAVIVKQKAIKDSHGPRAQ